MGRENCIKKTHSLLVDIVEEGEGKTNWEGSINMYTIPCIKYLTVSWWEPAL